MFVSFITERIGTYLFSGVVVSGRLGAVSCMQYCLFYLYLRSSSWGTFLMDIFREHEVSVLSCFVLLFQFCTVYVKGKGIYYFSLYALRIIKYVALLPYNLINCCKKTAKSFQIIIQKVYIVIFFCNPVLILF